MFTKSILVAALIAASVPAFANPGTDQLARLVGVEPGVYSLPQLIALQEAMRDNDDQTVKFILNGGGDIVGRGAGSAAVSTSEGAAQLAAQVGVEPGQYSVAEMIRLRAAIQEQDSETIRFILSGNGRAADDDLGTVTPGKAQLAATFGVNPADYTTAQLAEMFTSEVSN